MKDKLIVARLIAMTFALCLLSSLGYFLGMFPFAGNYWNIFWPNITFVFGFTCIVAVLTGFFYTKDILKGAKHLMIKMQTIIAGISLILVSIGRMIFNAGLLSESIWKWLWIVSLIVLGIATVVFVYDDDIEPETI